MKVHKIKFHWVLCVCLMVFHGNSISLGAGEPIGMVTHLKGDVVYVTEGRKDRQVRNFMKVHRGDRFKLHSEAALQIVYFDNGRKVLWDGPTEFEAGKVEKNQKKGPTVSKLTEDVSQEIRRVSLLVDMSRLQRTGSSQVRGPDSEKDKLLSHSVPLGEADEKIVHAAKTRYEALRKEADPQDIIPEMYLFSIMADYDQYGEMKNLIHRMRERQPENDQVDLIWEWFLGRM